MAGLGWGRRIVCGLLVVWSSTYGLADDPSTVDYFEKHIRPVLVNRCYECHSGDSEEVGGGLRLDSAAGLKLGGDSGPAFVAGQLDESVLLKALRYEGSEMPPDGQLPNEVIQKFERWMASGAIDPRTEVSTASHGPHQIDLEKGRRFWSFRPVQDYMSQHDSLTQVVDELLNQSLLENGVDANPMADPQIRLRRLAFDLTGLPPSLGLSDRWLSDPTPQNWEAVVDELLDSRAFAQHWARHWMDVARYADSNGADFNATFHEAWRYRDYLVGCFDRDQSFDQMIRQQVAGDLLKADDDVQRYDNVVATTFLMLGTKMLSERNKEKLKLDVVDEQIDTVGRAFLGMTLGCARCHDHKFDPIPTEDYYALAGIFRSTQTLNGESQKYVSTWNRVKLPVSEEARNAIQQHASARKNVEKKIKELTAQLDQAKALAEPGIVVDNSQAKATGRWVTSSYVKPFFGTNYFHDDNAGDGKASLEYRIRLPSDGRYRVWYSYSTGGSRATNVPIEIESDSGLQSKSLNQRKKPETGSWTSLGEFNFKADVDAVLRISNRGTNGHVIADAVRFVALDGQNSSSAQAAQSLARLEARRKKLNEQLSQLSKNAPPGLPEAMAPRDLPDEQIRDSPVHIRGELRNRGPIVSRGFPQVCSTGTARITEPEGSGRRQLADWLTDPDNPLVARVTVNRIWMHLFGHGIVRTVDNFGIRGERPTHPRLLDKLALEFIRGGWKFKATIRSLVLTEAYQRSAGYSERSVSVDPENRMLWRANRKRIPAESIRDTMLQVAGVLSEAAPVAPMESRGVLVSKNNGDSKADLVNLAEPIRTIYLPVVRGNIPTLLGTLDAADPDLLVGRRPTTNVPGQALVLLNSVEVNLWAEKAAQRILKERSTIDEQIGLVFRECLSRSPTTDEVERAVRFLNGSEQPAIWAEYVAAIFASTEFRYTD